MRVAKFSCGFLILPMLLLQGPVVRGASPSAIALSESTVTLTGPWKFRTGDDLGWSHPSFDDGGWERVDLECASVVFDVLLFALLLRRLWSYARFTPAQLAPRV